MKIIKFKLLILQIEKRERNTLNIYTKNFKEKVNWKEM